MKRMTKNEMFFILGGCEDKFNMMVANANANGADWTAEQWDEWAEKLEAAAH